MSKFTFPVIFGQRGLATTQQLLEAGVDVLVTDEGLPDDARTLLADAGVRVILAPAT